MIGWAASDMIDDVWDKASPMISKALEYNRDYRLLEHVYEDLKAGTALLLFQDNWKNICVIKNDYPILVLELFNGCLFDENSEYNKEWFIAIDGVAKELKCTRIRIFGRPGWTKRLKPYGYNHIYTVVEKEVENHGWYH